jgi:pyrroloquinoline quinone (PQQ) biosynthesis protein C
MKKLLSQSVQMMGEATAAFPWRDPAAYSDWLAQTYFYVRHSTRLLAVAAGRFGHDPRGDALHHRFGHHMGEENRHELLALNDLKHMKTGTIERFTELPSTRSFYEVQYAKIVMQDPNALFGYILPLEIASAKFGRAACDAAKEAFGAACVSFLKVHVEEDPDHVDKALQAVEGLGGREEALIAASIEQTAFGYCAMLEQIVERARTSAGRFNVPSTTASAVS